MAKKQAKNKRAKRQPKNILVNKKPNPVVEVTAKDTAAPDKRINNEFWKMRSKHGRDKLFASPKLMWEAACEYFQWCVDNPFMRAEAKSVSHGMNAGSSIEIAEVPVMRPFTLHGLCLYIGASTSYFRTFKYEAKKEADKNKDFLTVIEQIEETIYEQKFSGAASGFLNANIISRDLGLKDHADVTTNGQSFRIGYKKPTGSDDNLEDE